MSLRTFLGGIHPNPLKERTRNSPIIAAPLPGRAVIALAQGGAPGEPLVKVGDRVLAGQKIAESKAFVSAPVHASVSGIVTAITEVDYPTGRSGSAIIIENDEKDDWIPCHGSSLEELSPDEIRNIVKEAGLVGMGGAMFPSHVKVSPPPGKTFNAVIVNGAECEPFLTCDHRLMLEQPAQIIYGLRAWLKATGTVKGYIGVESNKENAILALRRAASGVDNIEIVRLTTKYPQGSEKQLIDSILGRQVPSGGLPADAGALVFNVGTTFALAEAITLGRPVIERVVTVTGTPVHDPQNFRVRIGTLFSDLLAQMQLDGQVGKLISGGPMMGIAQTHAEVPVMKGTSGILLVTAEEARAKREQPCIRCGRCVEACPIGLIPTLLDQYCRHEMWEQAIEGSVADCIECGCCAFVCPSKRDLVASLRLGKTVARSRRN